MTALSPTLVAARATSTPRHSDTGDSSIFGRHPSSQGSSSVATLPDGFQDTTVFTGLTYPTIVRFSPDGRVFVGEKSGLIKVFDSLSDPTPTIFADLTTNVDDYWDRGMLGLALPPDFPTIPYVYVLFTFDAPIGGHAPTWSDACPTPPGPTTDGCVVSGRLSRLQASGDVMVGPEEVLIEDWCQEFPSHSVGDLQFGQDGALYVSGGEGASFLSEDYGQYGYPQKNPCGDPPAGIGGNEKKPTAEGGALRSQDLQSPADPTALSGSILRVDPATGAALPDNPLYGSTDLNARRIVAYGERNPFRFTLRPGTTEAWVGNVGWGRWEEIDRVVNPTDPTLEDFGWPCYEAVSVEYGSLNLCNTFTQTPPYYYYAHGAPVVPGEDCPNGDSSITGLAFSVDGTYPSQYDGGLFFADYSRNCIWMMFPGINGLPDPANIIAFEEGAASPVDLEIGPGNDLFYADFIGGTIRRITYSSGNQAPTAVATANPTFGPSPLLVQFDGTGSSDPDPGDTLTYAWDLDGDGQYDDSTSSQPSYTYLTEGTYAAALQVTDSHGATSTAPVPISVDNGPPTAFIDTPLPSLTWTVGQVIAFAGHATDPDEGTLPPSGLSWTLIIHHCPISCHIHIVQSWTGVDSGSFAAPDHEYPSYLELKLTATDSGGLQSVTSVLLYPQTVQLGFQSKPKGLQLTAGTITKTAPFRQKFIIGSNVTITAISPQTIQGKTYVFDHWSDGGAQTHAIVAGTGPTTYQAFFVRQSLDPPRRLR
jgi:PKD repeat protein/glucose/arabinose dehydrogenase